MIWIFILVIIIVLLLNSLTIIPSVHFGVVSILGRRLRGDKGILREGLNFVVPLLSRVQLVSKELVTEEVKFHLTTKNGLKLEVQGVFQYRPDPNVSFELPHDDHGRNVFVTMSEDAIFKGIVEAIEARLGGLGGKHDHEVFISERQALGDIINGILRLGTPPHRQHELGRFSPDPENPSNPFCGRNDCEFVGDRINAEDLIRFYKFHWPEIKILMRSEKHNAEDRSEVEKRYGIDVESFDLGNVSFTEETTAALEEQEQARKRQDAAQQRLDLIEKFMKKGATFQQAADEADIALDPTKDKRVISVQGDAGILGGFLDRVQGGGGK